MLQKYAIVLLSKIIFRDWLTAIHNTLSGSALLLLELLEASSLESSMSSPSLETAVNLVPEAKATSTTIGLNLLTHVETVHVQYPQG